jgi:hypothetical protein
MMGDVRKGSLIVTHSNENLSRRTSFDFFGPPATVTSSFFFVQIISLPAPVSSDADLIKKLDSLRDEVGTVCQDSNEARQHLERLMQL